MKKSTTDMRRRRLLAGLTGVGAFAIGSGIARAACRITPYQVTGPFYPVLINDYDWDMTRLPGHRDRAEGKIIEIVGRILDEACRPVGNAVVDIWQANAAGRYLHSGDPNTAPLDPNFEGFARLITGDDGTYRVLTIVPGAYAIGPGTVRPPHIHFKVHPPMSETLTTQMYFAGNELNEKDRLFMAAPEDLRPMLTVDFNERGHEGVPKGTFDIHVNTGMFNDAPGTRVD